MPSHARAASSHAVVSDSWEVVRAQLVWDLVPWLQSITAELGPPQTKQHKATMSSARCCLMQKQSPAEEPSPTRRMRQVRDFPRLACNKINIIDKWTGGENP